MWDKRFERVPHTLHFDKPFEGLPLNAFFYQCRNKCIPDASTSNKEKNFELIWSWFHLYIEFFVSVEVFIRIFHAFFLFDVFRALVNMQVCIFLVFHLKVLDEDWIQFIKNRAEAIIHTAHSVKAKTKSFLIHQVGAILLVRFFYCYRNTSSLFCSDVCLLEYMGHGHVVFAISTLLYDFRSFD
jgi:hypothetical protein